MIHYNVDIEERCNGTFITLALRQARFSNGARLTRNRERRACMIQRRFFRSSFKEPEHD
jgi:hypothetical protein